MKKSVLTASACALLLAGCTPTTMRRRDQTALDFQGQAHIMTLDASWFRRGSTFSRTVLGGNPPCSPTMLGGNPHCSPVVQTLDGTPQFGEQSSYKVVPGAHTFVVAVQWSNGWQDQPELTFEAQRGKRYWILTYERAPGAPEETAGIRQYTDGEAVLYAGTLITLFPVLYSVAYVSAPLWLAGYGGYRGVRKLRGEEPATGRPFERCCFVWVQDEESGEVVAGERPGQGVSH